MESIIFLLEMLRSDWSENDAEYGKNDAETVWFMKKNGENDAKTKTARWLRANYEGF